MQKMIGRDDVKKEGQKKEEILIVGGEEVTRYLVERLQSAGHTVVVVHENPAWCAQITRETGVLCVCGDGSDPEILADAEIQNFDRLLALTAQDEQNFVICAIAQKQFSVPHVLALVHLPRNKGLFEQFGVPCACATELLGASVLQRSFLGLGE